MTMASFNHTTAPVADRIAECLGGRRVGAGWVARCPAHDDHDPSLSVREVDGTLLVKCFGGCSQESVIAALDALGLWPARPRGFGRPPRTRPSKASDAGDPRIASALELWRMTIPAEGTFVETYLHSRGIDIPAPVSIRFHPALKHPKSGFCPAMVALVTHAITATPVAVHRTFLALDGKSKAATDPARMMLGPCKGGVVRLGETDGVVMVGEGVETCMAAMAATGLPAWAALSTSGMVALDLPRDIHEVIVLADGDEPGRAAARVLGVRLAREGRRVRIANPPDAMDFNDLLLHEQGLGTRSVQ